MLDIANVIFVIYNQENCDDLYCSVFDFACISSNIWRSNIKKMHLILNLSEFNHYFLTFITPLQKRVVIISRE